MSLSDIDTHVYHRFTGDGYNVGRTRALQLGKRKSGPHYAVGYGIDLGKKPSQKRAQDVAVYEKQFVREFHKGCKSAESFLYGFGPVAFHGHMTEVVHRFGYGVHRTAFFGAGGVSAVFRCRQNVIHIPFFAGTYKAYLAVDAQQSSVHNGSAFVHDVFHSYALRIKMFHYHSGAVFTGDFLVVSEAKIYAPYGFSLSFQYFFQSFHQGDEVTFHIQRASPVNETVYDLSSERFGFPPFFRRRYHVLVRKETRRKQILVAAVDFQYQTVTVDKSFFGGFENIGIGFFQKSVKLQERFVTAFPVQNGNGRNLYRFTEPFSELLFGNIFGRKLFFGQRLDSDKQSTNYQKQNKRDKKSCHAYPKNSCRGHNISSPYK